MSFTPVYDDDGNCSGAKRDDGKFYSTDNQEFVSWLDGEGLTYQQWLDTNPHVSVVRLRPQCQAFCNNHCLNGGFEAVLPGTHTTNAAPAADGDPPEGILKLTGTATPSDVTKNSLLPGWQLFARSAGTSDDVYCYGETTVVNGNSRRAAKITSGAGTAIRGIMQEWSDTEYLEAFVAMARGKYFNFALDVKLSTALSSSLPEIFVETDGTGGATTTATATADSTDWERLFVVVQVPDDATYVKFGFRLTSTGADYYLDNAAVAITDLALLSLPYRPREEIVISRLNVRDYSWDNLYGAAPDTAYHPTGTIITGNTVMDLNDLRPAWATGAQLFGEAKGVDSAANIWRTAGKAQWDILIQAAATFYGTTASVISFGSDGQVEFSVTNASLDAYASVKGWIGEGL